jgi:predicted RNA-binding protein YlxR (DUF448 family)
VPRSKQRRRKHVPQRTCVGCRSVESKRSLVRVVRTQDGVVVDPSGKLAGRGAYLHDRQSCWQRGLSGSLAHSLKTNLTEEDMQRLMDFMQTLPENSLPVS